MLSRNPVKSLTPTLPCRRPTRRPSSARVSLEPLEDRWLPSFSMPVDVGADQPTTPGSGGFYPQAVVAADFNGDGQLDLATAIHLENTVSVVVGNGDGTFQAPRTFTCASPHSIRAGDLNADGKADLVVSNDTDNLRVLLGHGDGTFQPPQAITAPPQISPGNTQLGPLAQHLDSVAIADFNSDGKLDLVAGGGTHYENVTYYGPLDPPDIESHDDYYANVLLGNGDGTFRLTGITSTPNPVSPDAGDFNNDGRLDLLTGGGVLPGNGDGTFREFVRSTGSVGLGGASHPVGDFNGDGKLDVLSADYYTPVLMLGNGDGTFRPGQYLEATEGLSFIATAAGDVNADGKLDIVAIPGAYDYVDFTTTRSMSVLLGHGDGSFAPVVFDLGTFPGIGYLTSAMLADFDGDGLPDLATSDVYAANDGTPSVYRGPFVARNGGSWTVPPPLPPSMTIGDVTVIEGNTGTRTANFAVTLSKSWDQPVTVAYATANDTAAAGSDYRAASGTLTIPAGQTTGTIAVLVNGDRLGEGSETFVVNLYTPTNAAIVDGQGQGTIVDDEPRISIGNVARYEGRKNQTTLFSFAVTLSAAYDQPVTLSYRTTDGTAKAGDQDYVARTGTLTFAPGETTKTITIDVKGDSKKEVDETFYLDLFGLSSNSLFTRSRGVGTILNDD